MCKRGKNSSYLEKKVRNRRAPSPKTFVSRFDFSANIANIIRSIQMMLTLHVYIHRMHEMKSWVKRMAKNGVQLFHSVS